MRPSAAALTGALAAALAGCAVTYTDADGTHHVAGLVWVKYRMDHGPVVVQTRNLGLKLSADGPRGAGLQLGYEDVVRIAPTRPDAEYRLDFHTLFPFRARLTEHVPEPPAEPAGRGL